VSNVSEFQSTPDAEVYVNLGEMYAPKQQVDEWEQISRWFSAVVEKDTGLSIQWREPWWWGYQIQGPKPADFWAIDMAGWWGPAELIGNLVDHWKEIRETLGKE